MRNEKPNQKLAGQSHKQKVKVSVRDRDDGKVDIRYRFKPALEASTPETPALRVARKAIKAIEDSIE